MNLNKTANVVGLILFWGWNVLSIFLCVFLVGLAVLPFVFMAAINGEIPLSITLCLLILMITPVYSIYFGFKNPSKAVPFFFGVEIPVFILTIFRIFIVRELTLASGFLMLSAVLAVGIFAWSLKTESSESKRLNPYIATGVSTVVLITGLYVAILSGLYAFPMIIEFVKGLVSFDWWESIGFMDGLVFIMLALFFFGSLAFFVFPVFIAYFYPKFWVQKGKALASVFPKTKYYFVSLFVAVSWFGVFILVSHQGQADYVERLGKMTSSQQAIEMQNPKRVRKHLLKAYLNQYRYLGAKDQSRNLIPLYRRGVGSTVLGETAQDIQSFLLSPLLYKGKTSDGAMAGKLYTQLFDGSIQRDEQKAIRKALEATFNRDDVVAGLMNIGARNVLILEQNIQVEERGGYAVVEIEEVYENLTFERQEIFYYFSLPEDAAVTGIWIGQSDERQKMDAFIVAPRGAAQQVYEQQVRGNVDPALLEQVGPGQYRLRVFPIPVTKPRAQFSNNRRSNRTVQQEAMMRVHMRYVIPHGLSSGPTTQTEQVLPTLLEKRNVDWSRKTKRSLNGVPIRVKSEWMPAYDANRENETQGMTIALGERSMSLSMAPVTGEYDFGKLAVIVDTSYSMQANKDELGAILERLNVLETDNIADIDFFVSRDGDTPMSKAETYTLKDFTPFGSLTARSMITQFTELAESADYAGIILLTDKGLYGTDDKSKTLSLNAPLYFLHVDIAASAYDDDVLDLIYRTGGGVATSVAELQRQMSLNTPISRVSADRLWTISSSADGLRAGNSTDVKALAARQIILLGSFGQRPDPQTLDTFHDLAKKHDVVTPYSSMIVLVNERQEEALKKASEADDRFEREGRSGEETLTSPANPLVSGVPEPHEWLLILLSLLMLFWVWRNRDEWEHRLN